MSSKVRARSSACIASLFVAACAPVHPTANAPVRDALASFVVWTEAPVEAGKSAEGTAVDLLQIRGGQIVRLEVGTARDVEVAERASSASGTTESWSALTPRNGIVILRPSAFTSALLVSRGSVLRAHVGHGSDPGYYWFALEQQVLDWASGPLPAPFPQVAPRQRIDIDGFAELDRVLADAVKQAKDAVAAVHAARAIRRVAGLRAIRALRPATGFPYFLDTRPTPAAPGHERRVGGRPAYEVSARQPLELQTEGPAILHVFALVDAAVDDASTELRVLEGEQLRARASFTSSRTPLTSTDPSLLEATPAQLLRRAVVHVPPGPHRYRLETTTRALVAPLLAQAVVHLEDAGEKNEDAALATARQACGASDTPSICALALGLLGLDHDAPQTLPQELRWSVAIARSSASARHMAEVLASGGPRDPTLALEAAASQGDAAALVQLGTLITRSVDDATRASWVRSMWRGSEWTVAPTELATTKWSAVVRGDVGNTATCKTHNEAEAWPELTANDQALVTTSWHGVPTLELLVAAPCDDPHPVELVVDGEPLIANPSAGLVRWHVRVRGDIARARRVDAGRAHVYAIPVEAGACRVRWETIRAPRVAATSPRLTFGTMPDAPGLEIWLREGEALAALRVSSTPDPHAHTLRIVAPRSSGPTAYDDDGVQWTRVGRVALPTWAANGVAVTGDAGVAVRALTRVPRGARNASPAPNKPAPLPPVPLDEDALVALSRRILATPISDRGPLYLERALMLAHGGAEASASADARAAARLGTHGPAGEDAVELVRNASRRRTPTVEALPADVQAYGVEADFDARARRCMQKSESDRATFQRLLEQVSQTSDASSKRPYDPALAARALAARDRTPLDPRAPSLVARALLGSRWRLTRDLAAGARRVRREPSLRREGPVDRRGELRPRVASGARFEDGSFATVTAQQPAQAVLAGLPRGARVRVDLVCVPNEPAQAIDAPCSVEVQLGRDPPLQPEIHADGSASVSLELPSSSALPLAIRVAETPARWVALARIVLDRPARETVRSTKGEWVLRPKRNEGRYLVAAGDELAFESKAPTLLRVTVHPEDGTPVELSAQVNGRTQSLIADGSPVVLALPEGGRVVIKPVGANVSVAIAERVASDAPEPPQQDLAHAVPDVATAAQEQPAALTLRLDAAAGGPAAPRWIAETQDSPPPLTPLDASLGTVVAATGAIYGTLRQGSTPGSAPDGFAFGIAGYRRRIESLGLWTDLEAFSRVRAGEPTYGATGVLYEEIEPLHLRLSVELGGEAQQVAGIPAHVWLSRGFAEYSWRATRDFFVLPRVGYDGVYMSLRNRPTSLAYVDDEVYNAYRMARPTFLFAQALLWYTPYFNQILYLRLRGSFDPGVGVLSHTSARPGAFVAFGNLDLSAFLDGVYYPPADSFTGTARFDQSAGFVARYNCWSNLGSLDVQPGFAAFAHLRNGGWQVNVFVNLFASHRRGLRDFSSLELDFPEQLGGGIPWRGSTPGAYR